MEKGETKRAEIRLQQKKGGKERSNAEERVCDCKSAESGRSGVKIEGEE
jgi:hypothetical protein